MNKQELIKKLKELLTTPSELEGYDFDDGYDLGIESAIVLAEELDDTVIPQEPKKVVIPEYVADWIEWCKKNKVTLLGADTAICNNKNISSLDASGWAMKNQETFAKAWLYGYEIEKEKLYRAKNRHTGEYLCYCFKFYHDKNSSSENQRFTAEEKLWKELGYWGNDLYVFEEVKVKMNETLPSCWV